MGFYFNVEHASYFILLFVVFSILGWCMEVSLKYIEFHRFINRGFLIGPYCPIYGSGVLCITLMNHIVGGPDVGIAETFINGFIFCGILEYFVSWYLEKMYHARWWDYSHKPMNLNGRVWMGNLLLFGIGSLIIVKGINPLFFRFLDRMPKKTLWIVAIVSICIMAVDSVISHFVMNSVKVVGEGSKEDNTEAISKEIRRLLRNKSFLHRRLVNAYPNMRASTNEIRKRMAQERKMIAERTKQERLRLYEEYQKIKEKVGR